MENNQQSTIGRPKMKEKDKTVYRHISFYFPLEYYSIYGEFRNLCQKHLVISHEDENTKKTEKINLNKVFRNRGIKNSCTSIQTRRLIFDFVDKYTKSDDVKKLIILFKNKEKERLHGIVKKWKKR